VFGILSFEYSVRSVIPDRWPPLLLVHRFGDMPQASV